jgi:hypothetical protein
MKPRFIERLGMFAMLVCLSLLCAVGARAQETGDIVGTVTDSTGAVVPNATVTLTNTGTNVSQTAQTAGDGNYLFTLLQVGNYVVKVQATGFKTASNAAIALSSGDRARVDVKLEIGSQTTTVEVQATVAPALQTDSSNVGQLVSAQSVEDLPLNGRNLIQLVFATPGVTSGSPGSIVQGNRPDDRRLISSFSVNGQTDTMNNNMIDGMDNNERIIGTIGVRPSIDAVQEVNVQTNKYDASVGRTGGGVVDVITKSGTNSYHGSAYEFFRNKVLNTNPNYNFNEKLAQEFIAAGSPGSPTFVDPHTTAAANPAFQQNQFGGSMGGPIRKDKTFFFADYEGLDYNTGTNAAFYSVPTLCERGMAQCPDGLTMNNATTGYDFSDNPSISQPLSQQAGGTSAACTVTNTNANLVYGSTHCPYVTIPVASTTPLGRAYFNMYPLPNTGAAGAISSNYTSAPVKRFRSDTYDGRVDQHFSDKDTLYGRYTHNGETTTNPNGFPQACLTGTGATAVVTSGGSCTGTPFTPVVLQYAGPNDEVQDALAFSYVHVYNPNLLLNLRAGAFRSAIISLPANNNSDITNKLMGFCNALACANAESQTKGVIGSGLATDTVTGLNSAGTLTAMGDTSFIPLLEFDTTFQYMGTLTWNHGPHSVRFGVSLIRRRATIGQSNNPQGTFTFNGSFTGVAAGDLLEGLNSAISRNNALDQPGFRTWEPGIYVQDDWRARSWLTVNLGLRYDIFSAYTEVHGRMSNYDPFLGLVESPAIPGVQQSGPTAGVPTPLRDIAPRLGFAATLHHNMVLRGGFGLTYFPVNYESPYYMKNQPFGYTATCALQSNAGTVNSCASALFNGAAGEFNSGLPTNYATTGSGGTAYAGGSCALGTTIGCGGALFANSIPTPVLNIALATNQALYAGQTEASVPINLQENYLEQFNLELQKQFGANVLNVGYVGQRGVHVAPLNSGTNQNLPANPTENIGGPAGTLPLVVGGNSYAFGPLQGYPLLATTTVQEEANIGTSFYNALQVSLVRRFSHGLTVNFNYVWSHMMDNVDGNRACVESIFASPQPCWFDAANGAGTVIPGTPPTAFFSKTSPQSACVTAGPAICKPVFGWQNADMGTGTQNVPNRVSWGINYQIPFGSSMTGVEGLLIKGWAVNTTGSWQTGLPFSVSPSLNNSGISGAGYVDQICSGKGAHPSLLNWYNESCFVQATPGLLGDERPNQLYGPSQKRLDGSIFKEFPLKEGLRMQFRAEVFNLFNTVSFNTPNATLAFSNAGPTGVLASVGPNIGAPGSSHITGEITTPNANFSQREIQFALKLLF